MKSFTIFTIVLSLDSADFNLYFCESEAVLLKEKKLLRDVMRVDGFSKL